MPVPPSAGSPQSVQSGGSPRSIPCVAWSLLASNLQNARVPSSQQQEFDGALARSVRETCEVYAGIHAPSILAVTVPSNVGDLACCHPARHTLEEPPLNVEDVYLPGLGSC